MTIILQQIENILFCVLLGWCVGCLIIKKRTSKYLIVFQVLLDGNNSRLVGSEMFSINKSQLNLSFIKKLEDDIAKALYLQKNIKVTKVMVTAIIPLN